MAVFSEGVIVLAYLPFLGNPTEMGIFLKNKADKGSIQDGDGNALAQDKKNMIQAKAVLLLDPNHRYVLCEFDETDDSMRTGVLPPQQALVWCLQNGLPVPDELAPDVVLAPPERKPTVPSSSPSENDKPSQSCGITLTFESVSEREIGFSPDKPWLGCESREALLDRVWNREVELRVATTGVVILTDNALSIVQCWEPPSIPNRGKRDFIDVMWEIMETTASIQKLSASGFSRFRRKAAKERLDHASFQNHIQGRQRTDQRGQQVVR